MKVIRRTMGIFRDSPTYGRDRASLMSGFMIGITALLLNGAVLILVLPLMLDPDDPWPQGYRVGDTWPGA